MTNKTWVGGHSGNNAMAADNWSPSGIPQPGDNLTVVSGTLEIGRTNLAGDILHLQNQQIGGGPVTLDLNGGSRIGIDGSLFFGDDLAVNAKGSDRLDASGGFHGIYGSINLADHASLVVTGSMQFAYAEALTGGVGAKLTNNGTIRTANGNVSVAVNGTGTLGFAGYHSGHGYSVISAAIGTGQTVEMNTTNNSGLTLELADAADFHGLLKINPSSIGTVDASVVLDGVKADGYTVSGNKLTLTNGGTAVDSLRVANAGSVPIAASYGPDSTTLTFHTYPLS